MVEFTLWVAFIAGLLSFLSPCVLPLIPGFLGYLAGTSSEEIKRGGITVRSKIFINTIFFVLGFSIIFAAVGVLINSIFLESSYLLRVWLGRIGGSIIILFGLYIIGLLKLPFLDREHKLKAKKFKYSYVTSFVFGATFAVGWTPCVGAVLGGVLTLAVTQPGSAYGLLTSYSLGLTLPFLMIGLFTSRATDLIKKYAHVMKYVNYVAGAILILLGILVFTNSLNLVANLSFVNNLLLG